MSYRVFDRDGTYRGSAPHAEDAGMLLAGLAFGDGGETIRGAGDRILWTEGADGMASESYDAVAEVVATREEAARRTAHGPGVAAFSPKVPAAGGSITGNEAGATGFDGAPAVDVFRATVLASSLRLYGRTKMLSTRGLTVTKMLAFATEYTGKIYRRTQAGALIAADDVNAWARAAAGPMAKAGREEAGINAIAARSAPWYPRMTPHDPR